MSRSLELSLIVLLALLVFAAIGFSMFLIIAGVYQSTAFLATGAGLLLPS